MSTAVTAIITEVHFKVVKMLAAHASGTIFAGNDQSSEEIEIFSQISKMKTTTGRAVSRPPRYSNKAAFRLRNAIVKESDAV